MDLSQSITANCEANGLHHRLMGSIIWECNKAWPYNAPSDYVNGTSVESVTMAIGVGSKTSNLLALAIFLYLKKEASV